MRSRAMVSVLLAFAHTIGTVALLATLPMALPMACMSPPSPRYVRMRELLAGAPSRGAFGEIVELFRNPNRGPLPPWRSRAESDAALAEAERALARWDDSVRYIEGPALYHTDYGDQVQRWARLVRQIRFGRLDANSWQFTNAMRSPHLEQLKGLAISRSEIASSELARSRYVRSLRWLSIHDTVVDYDALSTSPNLSHLERLTLSGNYLTAGTLGRLLDGTPGRSLRELELHIPVGTEQLNALLERRELLPRLVRLDLRYHSLRDSDLELLAAARDLENLRTLDLRDAHIPFSERAKAMLRRAPQFAHTEILFDG